MTIKLKLEDFAYTRGGELVGPITSSSGGVLTVQRAFPHNAFQVYGETGRYYRDSLSEKDLVAIALIKEHDWIEEKKWNGYGTVTSITTLPDGTLLAKVARGITRVELQTPDLYLEWKPGINGFYPKVEGATYSIQMKLDPDGNPLLDANGEPQLTIRKK